MKTITTYGHEPWSKGKLAGQKPRCDSRIFGPLVCGSKSQGKLVI
jgi:hypothetical protein